MNILPPLLPELDGSRPAAASIGQAAATVRLGARVVAVVGTDAVIETRHGQALLQGAPAVRPGDTLALELRHAEPALAGTGRLVAIGRERLEPPLPVRVLAPSTPPAATVRSAAPLEVSLRVIGPDGRPASPAFAARLVVPLPEPGPAASGAGVTTAALSGGAVGRGSVSSGSGAPGAALLPSSALGPQVTSHPTPVLARASAEGVGTGITPSGMPHGLPEELAAFLARSQAVDAVVLPRDALGRALLHAAGFNFRLEPPLDLPVGARLQLILPVARPGQAPLADGPLEAVRALAAALREHPGMAPAAQAGTLRLPEPDATLAARLLRLIELIAPRSGDANVRTPAAPATAEGQLGPAGITAAVTELGRLAAEPQSGGWRMLLLPLGFAATPLLRLYVREDPERGAGRERDADRSPAIRRAVFELDFDQLGRAQIDVLCQPRRFDLLVRTARPLPPDLRREIRELYLAARDVAGLVGAIRFHAGRRLALPEPAGAGGLRSPA